MSRGIPLTTRCFFVSCLSVVVLLVTSACGGSREEATPTPLPPTQAELAAQNTPTAQPPAPAEAVPAESEGSESPAPESLPSQDTAPSAVTTASGLQYIELRAGSGPQPQPGEVVTVHYNGTLEDGTVFDSSYERGEPIRFALGKGLVIDGWDEGIALMHKGGMATLIIPPDLAYGEEGYAGVIPPNATLTFDVELIDISPGSPAAPEAVDEASYTTTAQGIKYIDLVAGDGPEVINGQLIVAHYTGWLEDGTKFDSSIDRGEPYTFNLGMGQVIAGWDLGVRGMRIGGTRQLVIPPNLAYGEKGFGDLIPPNATLIFQIEVLDAE